jgi:ubiquinone/menaquinone biosynthesis C-methylase UbiE
MEQAEYLVMAAVEGRHWWYGGMRAITASMLDLAYAGRRDLHMLDAGCGSGGNIRFLRRYGSVIGIDLATEALALGRESLQNDLAQASVLAIPFADASFDLVTSFDVLYHRAVPDERTALREAWRVLRPGGRLLLRLPAYQFLLRRHDREVHTRRRYTASHVRALLQSSGFGIERCSYINTVLFPLAVAQQLAERALPAYAPHGSNLVPPTAALNEVLRWPLAAEAAWIACGRSFPFGLSIMCLARKT